MKLLINTPLVFCFFKIILDEVFKCMRPMKIALIVLVVFLLLRLARSVWSSSSVEKPKVIAREMLQQGVELRTLAPMIQASVVVT